VTNVKLEYGYTLEEAPNFKASKKCILLEMQNRVVEGLYHRDQEKKHIPLTSCGWVNFPICSRTVGTCLKNRVPRYFVDVRQLSSY